MLDVFVSRPTWIPAAHQKGLDAFLTRLRDSGFKPRTLGASDYALVAPMDEVLEIMSECRGAIVLGYPQITISGGSIKAAQVVPDVLLGTEWNHIEAALAYARHLPLLIVHHQGVSRGVFDRGVLSGFIYETDLSSPLWCHEASLSGALEKWKERVSKFSPTSSPAAANATAGLAAAPVGSVLCPNCSTPERPRFMMKLTDDWIRTHEASHYCSQCKSAFKF